MLDGGALSSIFFALEIDQSFIIIDRIIEIVPSFFVFKYTIKPLSKNIGWRKMLASKGA
jgi:hypothetical protein